MIVFLVITLLVIVLVFGLTSISQSYATAKQAEATIETARVAHTSGIGNLILIVLVVLLVTVIIGISILFFVRFKSISQPYTTKSKRPRILPAEPPRLDHLLTLLVVQMLQSQMDRDPSQLALPPVQDDESIEDHDLWLLP